MQKEKIELITQVSLDINAINDLSVLLETILTKIRLFFNADAGSIYLKDDKGLKFSYTQNSTLQRQLGPGKKLVYNTFVVPVNKDSVAGYVALYGHVLNIPDVHDLDGSEPYRFNIEFDTLSGYRTESLLTVPMINQQGRLLGVMQMINAKDRSGAVVPFSGSDETLIQHFAASAALAVERAAMTRNIIMRTIRMAELRDPMETGSHVNRVAAYSIEIYEAWAARQGLASEEIERNKDILRMAAMLHDVGKIAISDTILKKPGRLSQDEFELIKGHTVAGAQLFTDAGSDFDQLAAEVALNHHERWDGKGYPGHVDLSECAAPAAPGAWVKRVRPKRGEEIPVAGRIVAVADVYDALCSRRSYKEPWDKNRILEEMKTQSGKAFDPEIVEAFFSCLDLLEAIARRYPDKRA